VGWGALVGWLMLAHTRWLAVGAFGGACQCLPAPPRLPTARRAVPGPLQVWRQTTLVVEGPGAGGEGSALPSASSTPRGSDLGSDSPSSSNSSSSSRGASPVATIHLNDHATGGASTDGEGEAGQAEGARYYTHDGLPQPYLVSWTGETWLVGRTRRRGAARAERAVPCTAAPGQRRGGTRLAAPPPALGAAM
jgi:hypothetical protein